MDILELTQAAQNEGIQLDPEDKHTRATMSALALMESVRDKRAQRRNAKLLRWGLPIATAILSGASFGGYQLVKVGDAEVKTAADVADKATTATKSLAAQVEDNQRNVEKLGILAVEQQELTLEAVEYIGDKIDAAHPKAPATDLPPALERAGEETKKRKRETSAKALLDSVEISDAGGV